MRVRVLVSPLARGAFFVQTLEVAAAELALVLPRVEAAHRAVAELDFLEVEAPTEALPRLARLSWAQGLFEVRDEVLRALDQGPGFVLPRELVWGAKYRGKTHEVLTQLVLNAALALQRTDPELPVKLLDPMAGRGTTLLWAARYGLDARGLELDERALDDLHRHVKRQTKLHRIKHKTGRGRMGRAPKGRFVEYRFEHSTLRLVHGDTRHAPDLLQGERFTALVADLPYGIEHRSASGTRDPLPIIAAAAPGWARCLRPGGALALSFNSFLPRREALAQVLSEAGLEDSGFSAPHRVSESIQREVVVFLKSRSG